MKKLLISLTILLVVLFNNLDSVNAESISISRDIMDENTDINSSSISSTYYYYYNSSDTYKNKLDKLILDIKNNHKFYYISLYGIYYWDDPDISIYAGALKYENTSGYVYSMFDFIANNPNKSNIYKIQYYSYINNNNSNPTIYNNNICLSPYMLYFSSTGQTNNAFDFSSYWVTPDIIYFSPKKYSNVSVVYDPYYLSTIFENDEYNKVYIVYDSISTPSSSYSTGDYIYTKKPNIKIYSIDNQENYIKVNVNFSIFDTNKYNYFYSIDSENWYSINENDFVYTSFVNNTLYVKIEDLENNYINAATYTFTNINETLPNISLNTTIPDYCNIEKDKINLVVCKNLDISITNYKSIDKYIYQFSYDNESWTNIYSTNLSLEFSESKTMYFRLYDRINNEIINIFSYDITGVSYNSDVISSYLKMFGSFNKNTFTFEVDTYFYNYDSSLYNYYYSTDGTNWIEFDLDNMLSTSSLSIKHSILYFYNDLTLYVKIENKNNEFVNAATYTITYFSHISDDLESSGFDIPSFINSINDSIKYVHNVFTLFFNSLPFFIKGLLLFLFNVACIFMLLRMGGWLG